MKVEQRYREVAEKKDPQREQGCRLMNIIDNRLSTIQQSRMVQAIQRSEPKQSIKLVGNGIACIQRALPANWQATIDGWFPLNPKVTIKNWDKNMTRIYQLFPKPINEVDKAAIQAYVKSHFNVPSSIDLQRQEADQDRAAELAGVRANLVKIVNRGEHMAGELPAGSSGAISGGHLPLEVHQNWDSTYNVTFNPLENVTCQRSDLTIKGKTDGDKRNYTKANIGDDKHTIFPQGMSLANLEAAVKKATKIEGSTMHFNIQIAAGLVEIETINLNDPSKGTLYPVV